MKRSAIWILTATLALFAESAPYVPFAGEGFLTSSFGENRGTRYHAGIDYSTDMREGFPVTAPEDGKISQVKLSPYGYGKVVYFRGKSGKTWVFAHQSGFSPKLDSLVRYTQTKLQKNDIALKNPGIPEFHSGDTISFTGSSGIGNPHLHLEIRLGDKVVNPCRNGTWCADTLDPFILGAATFRGEAVALSGESDLKAGCVEIPSGDNYGDSVRFAFKIADYSRTPLENPMSVRRVSLKRGGKIVDEIVKDTLSFANMIQIREELLWAEEADTAGDWHYMPRGIFLSPDDTLVFETEDMVGRIASRTFALSPKCDGPKPAMRGKFQHPEVFSFLSRTWIGLNLCAGDLPQTEFFLFENGKRVSDLCREFPQKEIPLGAILEKHPRATEIRISRDSQTESVAVKKIPNDAKNFSWKIDKRIFPISETVSGLKPVPWTRALAVRKLPNDSVPAFEFHPKGLHFLGAFRVSFHNDLASKPLYYLGETSRRWFLFGKQFHKKDDLSAGMDELRDIGFIADTTAPEIGAVREKKAFVAGKLSPVLRIPVVEKESGIANGNTIKAWTEQNPFIYAEYDSEPREIVIAKDDLPKAGEKFFLSIRDEAGNRKTFEIVVPEAETAPTVFKLQ